MGLDMYLTKKTYIGANYNHRDVKIKIDCTIGGKKIIFDSEKISEITERVGYWRKANAIHNWFVQNVQEGKDECNEHYVSFEQLSELKSLCQKILKIKDIKLIEEKLPPTEGFFFGSTEIDENYFADLVETIQIIESLDSNSSYYYKSSW
jgi:hypothetical protein